MAAQTIGLPKINVKIEEIGVCGAAFGGRRQGEGGHVGISTSMEFDQMYRDSASVGCSAALMQTTFIVYVFINVIQTGGIDKNDPHWEMIPLLFAAVFVNTGFNLKEVVKGIRIHLKRSHAAYDRILAVMNYWDNFIVPSLMIVGGGLWLSYAGSIRDLILDAAALGFITDVDMVLVQILRWTHREGARIVWEEKAVGMGDYGENRENYYPVTYSVVVCLLVASAFTVFSIIDRAT